MTVAELAAAVTRRSRMSAGCFALRGRNPDVLTCIANLSNDEVFTPPEFANRMLDTLAEAWAADNDGANIWADTDGDVPRPVHQVGRVPARDHQPPHQGLGRRDPGPRRARRPHPDQAGLRHRHHAPHEPARAPERLLLEVGQRRALDRQVASTSDDGQHLVRAHWSTRGSADRVHATAGQQSETHAVCDRGDAEPRDPRLRVHPHRRHQGSDRRAVWRRHAVRRDHRQPAVPARRRRLRHERCARSTSCSSSRRRSSNRATCRMVIPSRWFAGGKGWTSSASRCSPTTACARSIDYLSAADVFPGVGLKGGVCYFLWDRDNPGPCRVTTHFKDWPVVDGRPPASRRGRRRVHPLQRRAVDPQEGRRCRDWADRSLSLPETSVSTDWSVPASRSGSTPRSRARPPRSPVTCWSIRTAVRATSPRSSVTTEHAT